jgi:hypothetical protein
MATTKDPEKTIDLPPYGSRNPDPITDTPGSHPIETGVGAALAGAASGAAVGMVAGPVGTAIGAALGAVAGGYAGKGIGELIDPTTEDNWLRETFGQKKYAKAGDTYDSYVGAYRYAGEAERRHGTRPFEDAETDLRTEWEKNHEKTTGLPWTHARDAVRDAYTRTQVLREERLRMGNTIASRANRS